MKATMKIRSLCLITFLFICAPSLVIAENNKKGVEHIVFCWLNQPGNENDRQKFIELSYGLKEIPEVVSMKAGTPISSNRMFVDDTYDVGLSMSFKSEEDMESYLVNEKHVNLVKTALGPMCNRLLVYDIAH